MEMVAKVAPIFRMIEGATLDKKAKKPELQAKRNWSAPTVTEGKLMQDAKTDPTGPPGDGGASIAPS